jgi:hypothetical protein
LVSGLLAAPVVRAAIGDAVAAAVSGGELGPIAIVGDQIGAAVQQFLATPGVASGLGAVIGSIVPDFLAQSGVPGELAGVAGQFAAAVVAGEDLATALGDALDALKSSAAIAAAVKVTIADALNLVNADLLSVPAIQQEIGTIVTELVSESFAKLSADTAVVNSVAGVLGSAVTQLLGYPGFRSGLVGAVDQFADAVLDGATTQEAVQIALKWVESDPAFMAAVNAVVPAVLNKLLSYPEVRKAIGDAVKQETIARLKESGINNGFIDGVAGQVAGGTVDSFLGTRAGEKLIDDVVLNVLLGMPISDVTTYATQQVIRDPLLQIALGMSIGQGIGSLFGDNIIGELIGLVAGVPITLVIGVGSGIALVYQWLFGGPSLGANSAESQSAESHFFQPLSAASDTYVMSAIIPDLRGAEVAREAILANAQFTLTGMTLTEPDGAEPGSLDVMMTVAPESMDSGTVPEIRVSVGFRLDRLVAPTAPSSLPTDARRVQFS